MESTGGVQGYEVVLVHCDSPPLPTFRTYVTLGPLIGEIYIPREVCVSGLKSYVFSDISKQL